MLGTISTHALQLWQVDKYQAESMKCSYKGVTGSVIEDGSLDGGKGVSFTGIEGNGQEIYTKGISPMGSAEFIVNVKQRGLYEIYLGVKKTPSSPVIQLNFPDINTFVGGQIDLYSAGESVEEIKVADQYLDMGNSRQFNLNIVGKNPSSTGLTVTVDYIKIVLKDRYKAPGAQAPYFDDEKPQPKSPDSPYTWGQVMEGGTGRTLHVVAHHYEQGLMYLGTDMGGMYRWNPDSYTWKPVTDVFPSGKTHYFGIDSIALADTNPDLVYIFCGTNPDKGEAQRGEILKSTDRGETWTYTGCRYLAGANDDWRNRTQCLQVDPANENVLILATLTEGIYRSTDGAASFEKLNFPTLPDGAVPCSVVFDRTSISGDRTNRIFVSGAKMPLYVSEDGGDTWSEVPDSPVNIYQLRSSEDGTILVTAGSKGLFTYKNGVWNNITPLKGMSVVSAEIAHNNPDYIVTSWNYGPTGSYNQWTYYTTDGGKNWKNISLDFFRNHFVHRVEWGGFFANVTDIQIDPFDPKKVYMGGWQNFYMTEDIFASPSVWTNHVRGIEHGVTHDLMSIPSGARLLVSAYDYNGGRFTDVTQYMDRMEPPKSANSKIDFMETNPNFYIRIAKNAGVYSTNGGLDWKYFETWPESFTNDICGAAVSCDVNPDTGLPVIVMMSSNVKPHVTFDLGKTWQEPEGIPAFGGFSKWTRAKHLVSDRVTPGVFYATIGDKIYRSDDWGRNYTEILTIANKSGNETEAETVPYVKGGVWIAANDGLYKSNSYGELCEKVAGFTSAKSVSFGKPKAGSTKPTVFVYGSKDGERGIWKSADYGESWQLIMDLVKGPDPKTPVMFVEGDRQTEDLVYVATSGRGILYGHPTGGDNIFYSSRSDITVMVNNQPVIFDVPPMIDNGRTMVPMRYICEAMGSSVEWDGATQSITIKRHVTTDNAEWKDEIKMTVGSNKIVVNGEEQTMDCAPMIVNGRTLVPARFIAQALGADVNWNGEKRVVEIFV